MKVTFIIVQGVKRVGLVQDIYTDGTYLSRKESFTRTQFSKFARMNLISL
jgi:hypothetical protein